MNPDKQPVDNLNDAHEGIHLEDLQQSTFDQTGTKSTFDLQAELEDMKQDDFIHAVDDDDDLDLEGDLKELRMQLGGAFDSKRQNR
jgi:hypothetical protein